MQKKHFCDFCIYSWEIIYAFPDFATFFMGSVVVFVDVVGQLDSSEFH